MYIFGRVQVEHFTLTMPNISILHNPQSYTLQETYYVYSYLLFFVVLNLYHK